MNSEDIMLSEIHQSQKDKYSMILFRGCPVEESHPLKGKEMVGQGAAGWGWGVSVSRGQFQFGRMRKFYRRMVGMVAQ